MSSFADRIYFPVILLAALPWLIVSKKLFQQRPHWSIWLKEILCLALVETVALYAVSVFFYAGQVGAGDSFHYSLQIADAIAQTRAGIHALIVGQSAYAFNGNIHTIRTAPYLVHFGVLIDILTGRKLPPTAITDITILLSGLGGGLSAYFVARKLCPGRIGPALLAAAYITAPALLVPIYHYDLLATFLCVPWQPLLCYGVVLAWKAIDDREGLAWTVLALVMMWYAHPPTALWCTFYAVLNQLIRVILVGRAPGNIKRPLLAGAIGAVLISYLLYSVWSMHLPPFGAPQQQAAAVVVKFVQDTWPACLKPLASAEKTPLADLQLGIAMWPVLLFGIFASVNRKLGGIALSLIIIGFCALLMPIPLVTAFLWRHVPGTVLNITNVVPMQRFYVILAALTVVNAAVALCRVWKKSKSAYAGVCLALFLVVGWNLHEITPLLKVAATTRLPYPEAIKKFRTEQVEITRSSYLLFKQYPLTFSHGQMDPEFELRLLDSDGKMISDNTTALLRTATAPWQKVAPVLEVTTDGVHDYLLNFHFVENSGGTVLAKTSYFEMAYGLPQWGQVNCFGSAPTSLHTLRVSTGNRAPTLLTIACFPTASSVQLIPFRPESLPYHLNSLLPLSITLQHPVHGILETPRVLIPGYVAKVDGKNTKIVETSNGLVGVPVDEKVRNVVVSYPGPPGLRVLYYLNWILSGLALIALGTILYKQKESVNAPTLDWGSLSQFSWIGSGTPKSSST